MKTPSIFILKTPAAYWQGLFSYKLGNLQEADTFFTRAVETKPDHAHSWHMRGQVQVKQKKWEQAFPHLQKAVYLDLTNEDWLRFFRNTESRLAAGSSPRSHLTVYEIQERIDSSGESAFLYSQLAWGLRRQSNWWLEIEALKSAVDLNGQDSNLRFRLGYALTGMKRFKEAVEQLERAMELKPGNAAWHYQLGRALSEPGDHGPLDAEKARRHFEIAVAGQKSERMRHLGLGSLHQEAGNWALAAEAYAEQASENPENARLHFFLGTVRQKLYQWKQAADAYRNAVALEEGRAMWHFRLGFVSERGGDLVGAADAYAAAIQHSAEPTPLWNYRLGHLLERLGNFEEACTAYDNATVQILSEAEEERNADPSTPRTVDELSDALQADATDPQVWFEFAVLLEEKEKWNEAATTYSQALSRSSKHQPEWYHRHGRCLTQAKHYEAACASFRSTRILQRPYGVSQTGFRSNAVVRRSASFTEYSEVLKIDPKKVLYESFHGAQLSCNPYALFLYMLENSDFSDWTHVWVVNDMASIPEKFRALRNVLFVSRGSDGYIRHLTTSKTLINNTTFPAYFMRREEQVYLNTWHGTPWKTLGKDDTGQSFVLYGNTARNLLHATHVISSNDHTTRVLMDKFDIEHLFRGVATETGYPRIDLTLNATDSDKQALRERLCLTANRKILLYAPTWRGKLGQIESETNDILQEVGRLMKTGCQVLFRGHFLSETLPEGTSIPEDISTNDILSIVDILVTDYSSISFDFMATGRPIIYYLNDYEVYKKERGLYFEVEELPGVACYDLESLCSEVEKTVQNEGGIDKERYSIAKRKFCPMEDGCATKRVIDLITEETVQRTESNQASVLIYGGNFAPNGVTASLLNLLQHLDHSKINTTVVVDPIIRNSDENMERLEMGHKDVNIIARSGQMNLTMEERWVCQSFNKDYRIPDNPELINIYCRAYSREYKRLFGGAKFTASIEFTGYSSFWSSVIACAPSGAIAHKSIYQHSDIYNEWITRFPQLERIFWLYPYFDRLISVCESTRNLNVDSLAGRLKLPVERFNHCDNMLNPTGVLAMAEEAIDDSEIAKLFSGNHRVFISVARLSVEKDHKKLITAFAKLTESRSDSKLVLIGDGPLYSKLRRLVSKLGIEEHVHLLGYRSNPFPYVKKSDCLILSSNYEGQGLVLFEAMILNKAIISTDIAACRSVIENRSGLLVENSIDGFVRGMKKFLNGEITTEKIDLTTYQTNALEMFYRTACNLRDLTDQSITLKGNNNNIQSSQPVADTDSN